MVAWQYQVLAAQALRSTLKHPEADALEMIQRSIPFGVVAIWLSVRHLQQRQWRLWP